MIAWTISDTYDGLVLVGESLMFFSEDDVSLIIRINLCIYHNKSSWNSACRPKTQIDGGA